MQRPKFGIGPNASFRALQNTNHATVASGPVDAPSNRISRLGISGIALPAMPCRSPTIPTVESPVRVVAFNTAEGGLAMSQKTLC